MPRRALFVLFLAFGLLALTSAGVFAQGGATKDIGLVVTFPDGTTHTEIVTVPATATAIDALRAANLGVVTSEGAFGTSLCKINDTGCPAENCFCSPDKYWAYYHLSGSAWSSAFEGVGVYVPADQAVEGFAWSGFDANYNPTVQPPVYTFDELVVMQDPLGPVIDAAIQWLHGQQLADGSFGGPSKTPSAAITSDVVYALALAGEDVDGPAWTKGGQSALDALAKMAPAYIGSDAGQAGKVARAAAAAGANPRSFGGVDVIAVIESAYSPATGRYHSSFLFRQTLAMDGLRVSREIVPAAAYQALRDAQLPDGGWFWSFGGAESDVDTTGRVLQVLSRELRGRCDYNFDRAVAYLARAQSAGGAWAVDEPPSTSEVNANSTALAVGGLRANGRDPEASPFIKGDRNALTALLSFQEPGGAFVYIQEPGKEELRITATTDALIGLLQTSATCQPVYLPVVLAR